MESDPIVREVRVAGARLASQAGYDMHRFFESLRKAELGYNKALVHEPLAKRKPVVRQK